MTMQDPISDMLTRIRNALSVKKQSVIMPYSKVKDGFTVSKTFVAFLVEPVNELLNEYNKVFGSGLVLPPSPAQQPFDGSKPQPVAPSDSHAFVKI